MGHMMWSASPNLSRHAPGVSRCALLVLLRASHRCWSDPCGQCKRAYLSTWPWCHHDRLGSIQEHLPKPEGFFCKDFYAAPAKIVKLFTNCPICLLSEYFAANRAGEVRAGKPQLLRCSVRPLNMSQAHRACFATPEPHAVGLTRQRRMPKRSPSHGIRSRPGVVKCVSIRARAISAICPGPSPCQSSVA